MVDTYVFGFYFAGITAPDGSVPNTPRGAATQWLSEFVDAVASCDDLIRSYSVFTLGVNEAIVSITFRRSLTETRAVEAIAELHNRGLSGWSKHLQAQHFTVDVYAHELVESVSIRHAIASSVVYVDVTENHD